MIITPSLSSFSIVFSNQRFRVCSSAVDVRFVKLSVDMWKKGLQDWY